MRGRIYSLGLAAAIAALGALAIAGAGAGGQFLQLVELHGAGGAGGFHQGDRHQGRLRYLRRQRDTGDAAAGGKIGIRRRGSHRVFPAAPGLGQYFPETRQVEIAQSRQCVAGSNAAPCNLRSRQQFWRQLHVGHHRHRLQCQNVAENSRPRCQSRQLGHRLQAGESREVQGLRHSHAGFRRRYSSRRAGLSRARSQLDQTGRSRKGRRSRRQDQAVCPQVSFVGIS